MAEVACLIVAVTSGCAEARGTDPEDAHRGPDGKRGASRTPGEKHTLPRTEQKKQKESGDDDAGSALHSLRKKRLIKSPGPLRSCSH